MQDLNDGEREKLEQLLDNQPLQEVYQELTDPMYLKQQFVEYEKYSSRRAYAEFRERRGRFGRIRMIRWVAAVAAVWVLALGITLWMNFGEKKTSTSLPVASKIIPAGEKKAKLTLADGTEIEVAEMNTRVLQEEGVNIEYKDGEIAYVKGEEKPMEMVYNKLEVPRGDRKSVV